MNFGMIRYVLGWVMLCEGALLLLPTAVSLGYGEKTVWALLLTAVLCGVLGWLLFHQIKVEQKGGAAK